MVPPTGQCDPLAQHLLGDGVARSPAYPDIPSPHILSSPSPYREPSRTIHARLLSFYRERTTQKHTHPHAHTRTSRLYQDFVAHASEAYPRVHRCLSRLLFKYLATPPSANGTGDVAERCSEIHSSESIRRQFRQMSTRDSTLSDRNPMIRQVLALGSPPRNDVTVTLA